MIDTSHFSEHGWAVADLPDKQIAYDLIHGFKNIAGCELADIHSNYTDKTIESLRGKLVDFLWSNEYSLKIADALQPLLKEIIGLDVLTQYFPYLRLCRPQRTIDCFGFHQDSMFGGITPYEITAQLALTEVTDVSALQILSGSHRMRSDAFAVIPTVEAAVVPQSIKNRSGYPGGVRRHRVPEGMAMTPIVMHPGQVVIFSATMLLHGMEVNGGEGTRVAVDQHFVNANAPIKVLRGKVDTGYVRAFKSPLEKLIGEYREAEN